MHSAKHGGRLIHRRLILLANIGVSQIYVSTYVSADMKLQKLCRFINVVTSLLFTSILPNVGIGIGP